MRDLGGEPRAHAISRRATLSVDAESVAWLLLWRRRHNHGT